MPSVDLPPPFEAYVGDEPFVFVSYSHSDGVVVFEEILRLHAQGYRVWYDEGIDPGNEWPEEVARALSRSSFFIVFVSERSAASINVRNEINFALNKSKPFLAVHLHETKLPDGLDLRMGSLQAILRYRMSEESYHRKLESALPQNLKADDTQLAAPPSTRPRGVPDLWRRVIEAVEQVTIEISKYSFTGYEDRDNQGFLYAAYMGAPTRKVYEDKNSEAVWSTSFGGVVGQEIPELLKYVDQPGRDDYSRCRALLLLRHSLQVHPDATTTDRALALVANLLNGSSVVQDAALSLFNDFPCSAELKWKRLAPLMQRTGQERMSFVLRSMWQWVPPGEESGFSAQVFEFFARATTQWTACNCIYAIRKVACRAVLPAARDLLARTPSVWKAWYLARLAEDFEDVDSAPPLREAFLRHIGTSHFCRDIGEIIYKLEGAEALPFLCRTVLAGSESLQEECFGTQYPWWPTASVRTALENLVKSGSEAERQQARKTLQRMKGYEKATRWWRFLDRGQPNKGMQADG